MEQLDGVAIPESTSSRGGNIECPWCGSVLRDLLDEYGDEGDHEVECGSCGLSLILSVAVHMLYTLRPVRR